VPLSELVREYVFTTLRFSPIAASSAGYHEHNGVRLDELLDNYEESELAKIRQYLREFRDRLNRNVNAAQLNPEDRADYDIVTGHMRQWEVELDTIQNYKHNPTVYVELAGSALFQPLVVEYAPLETRYRHIIARLRALPAFYQQARQNLKDAPELWARVAIQENDGNRDLVNGMLREKCPPGLRGEYDAAATGAMQAISELTGWLKTDLAKRTYDWRLGQEKYTAKFGPTLGLDLTPEQVLTEAEAELKKVRAQMLEIARPLHQKGGSKAAGASDENGVIRAVLNQIAGKHATKATYFDSAKKDLAEATEFVRQKGLVPLPASSNLQVIPTPEFMRGIYSVGGFNPAPAMEPHLGAFYWLTPIPDNWPKERVESKLREYNHYGLKLLTIHEAIPGHYLQFEYANAVKPTERRLLRGVYGNGPYIEGWAVYATEMMLDEGYLDNDPQLRLTFLKQQLRMIANAILDVRLHTKNMTDQEALDLMMRDCFQEKEEATGKLQRAKLSSVQLPTYFTGWEQWWRIRRALEVKQGDRFRVAEFHRRALETGAVPPPALERILVGE
jgi:uncharacterized protein (DUF885 family)